ncbi:MAG: hypothetical protein FD169_2444 [Bacillota bacterium]|nr:MAG: hypothetical protein FD169_2444 [Bacillota bacterium]
MNTSVGPVPVKERIAVLDVIRGFALFGVLLVNMVMINYTLTDFSVGRDALSRPDLLVGTLDRIVAWTIQVVFQGKFYTIFAFLFGLGFYLFLNRDSENKAQNSRLFRRRIFFLLVAGLLHLIFVWWGDILTTYALIGFVLLGFRETKLPRLRNWIIGLLFFSFIIASASQLVVASPAASGTPSDLARNIYTHGPYWEVVGYRLANEIPMMLLNTVGLLPRILGLFLMGLYAGRSGIFQNVGSHMAFIRKAWRIGGIIGIGLSLLHLSMQLNANMTSAIILREISTPFLSLFYVTSIMLLWQADKLTALFSSLAALGRMAFTNYLVQCIVCALLFYGHGLGLMGNISIAYIPVLTVVIYAIQVIYSKWWLEKYAYGPAEWIWRRLTYAR